MFGFFDQFEDKIDAQFFQAFESPDRQAHGLDALFKNLVLAFDAGTCILVIGGRASANTRHLWEIARELLPSYLVHSPEDLRRGWFEGIEVVGLTAGASTPDYLIDEVEEAVRRLTKPVAV